MKLKFELNTQNQIPSIKVSYDKTLEFSLSNDNKINNDEIVAMLTSIAQDLTNNNFNLESDIVEISEDQLDQSGDLKELYQFLLSLFKSFINKFITSKKECEDELNTLIEKNKNQIKNNIDE